MSTVRQGKAPQPTFIHQPDAVLNQPNPVSGTRYVVLAPTAHARIISIIILCTWTVQPTPLELHVTLDGQPLLYGVINPVSTSIYSPCNWAVEPAGAEYLEVRAEDELRRPFWLEGENVTVEAEITGGTVQNLSARVKWARK